MEKSPEEPLARFCPAYTQAIEIIGWRWTGAIIRSMLAGASRFSEIAAAIPGLSDRLLSERLKELENEGIIERTVVPSTPVRVDYALTPKGKDLAGVVHAVIDWVTDWSAAPRPADQPSTV
jgi:DNA-binding HxlR family transcriptional regulator